MAKKKRAPRPIVSAAQWHRRIDQWVKSAKRDPTLQRPALSVEDVRDECVGLVHATYGPGQDAFLECYWKGGPHPSTLRAWEDRRVLRPLASSLRAAYLACGYDLGPVKREGGR